MAVQTQETRNREKYIGIEYVLAALAVLAVSAPTLAISLLERFGLPVTNFARSLPSMYEMLQSYVENDAVFWASFFATVVAAMTARFVPKYLKAVD